MNAYLRISEIGAPLPFSSDSGVVMEGTRRLVVLRKGGRILAVYQIAGGGTLKHLEREDYPRSLESRGQAASSRRPQPRDGLRMASAPKPLVRFAVVPLSVGGGEKGYHFGGEVAPCPIGRSA
jgi:hypothetical protein